MHSKLILNGLFSAAMGLAIASQILVGDRPAEAMTDAVRLANSEAQVEQAQGAVPRDLPGGLLSLLTPESGASQPSCDPSNAASPACYTATKQRTPPEGEIIFVAATAARATTVMRPTRPTSSEVDRGRQLSGQAARRF